MLIGYLYHIYIKKKDSILYSDGWKREMLKYSLLLAGIVCAYYFPGNVAAINSYFYCIGAVCTVYALYLGLNTFASPTLIYLGHYSMIVYGTHRLVSAVFRRLEPYIFSSWDGFPVYFIVVAGILLVCCMEIAIWNRMGKWCKRINIKK